MSTRTVYDLIRISTKQSKRLSHPAGLGKHDPTKHIPQSLRKIAMHNASANHINTMLEHVSSILMTLDEAECECPLLDRQPATQS
jgi:hypothetical protein